MHWWQIAIRLLLVANCLGNLRDAICAARKLHRERLHWLIPKVIAWAILVFGLIPTSWGGIGMKHWDIIVYSSAVLFYGLTIEMTDSLAASIFCVSFELPHIGRLDPFLMPLFMAVLSLIGFAAVSAEILIQHRITSNDKVLLIGFPLGLIFGVRLLLRQYSLSHLSDLVELAKFRSLPKPAQHHWIKPDGDEDPP